jgi:hypothetical protein
VKGNCTRVIALSLPARIALRESRAPVQLGLVVTLKQAAWTVAHIACVNTPLPREASSRWVFVGLLPGDERARTTGIVPIANYSARNTRGHIATQRHLQKCHSPISAKTDMQSMICSWPVPSAKTNTIVTLTPSMARFKKQSRANLGATRADSISHLPASFAHFMAFHERTVSRSHREKRTTPATFPSLAGGTASRLQCRTHAPRNETRKLI